MEGIPREKIKKIKRLGLEAAGALTELLTLELIVLEWHANEPPASSSEQYSRAERTTATA